MRVYWFLYYPQALFVCLFLIYVCFDPQALDDANKGIINELKKTNYKDLFKEKKEKGEFPELLRPQLQNFPLHSLCQSQPHRPVASAVSGFSADYQAF